MRLHDFNMIYCLLRADIAEAKNLMFNVIFYVVFFNYHFKISREGVAAKIKVESLKNRNTKKKVSFLTFSLDFYGRIRRISL